MPESYAQSALRHLADADRLAAVKAFHGAGYLMGYVVECAIKNAVEGTKPNATAPHKHLPDLIEASKKMLQGRRHQPMHIILASPQLMDGWSTALRYEADGAVEEATFDCWRSSALRVLAAAGLKRGRA